MRAFHHVVDFQELTKDGTASIPTGFSDIRCSIRQLSSVERVRQGMQGGEDAYELTMAHRDGIKPQWRILWKTGDDRILRIRGILNPRERGRWAIITAVHPLDEV